MKATLKMGFANVKYMSGGGAVAAMQAGDYVFGKYNTTKSDIVGFDHFFRANGTRFDLHVPCKVWAAFMAIDWNANEQPTDPPPAPGPIFGQVKDDFELYKLSRPTRNMGRTRRGWGSDKYVRGLPMVQPYNGVEPSLLDNQMIEFILRFQPPMGIENKLSNLAGLFDPDRAFNNFQSFDFHVENGIIVNKLTTKYYPVFCGRAKIKLFSRTPVRFKGVMSYPFEIINTDLPYSHFNPTDHPWLFFSPLNSVREPIFNPKGKWIGMYIENLVEPFHWFNGDTRLPIHGRGTNVAYISANLVKLLN